MGFVVSVSRYRPDAQTLKAQNGLVSLSRSNTSEYYALSLFSCQSMLYILYFTNNVRLSVDIL